MRLPRRGLLCPLSAGEGGTVTHLFLDEFFTAPIVLEIRHWRSSRNTILSSASLRRSILCESIVSFLTDFSKQDLNLSNSKDDHAYAIIMSKTGWLSISMRTSQKYVTYGRDYPIG